MSTATAPSTSVSASTLSQYTSNQNLASPTISLDLKTMSLPIPPLLPLARSFSKTYHDLARHSPTQFLATPISSLPTGLELGQFLALDLGGSNLRVAIINLLGKDWDDTKGDKAKIEAILAWVVPEEKKKGDVEELFDWIAECVQELLLKSWKKDVTSPIEVGVTWSFPMIQRGHTDAHIMPSGKGFALGLRNPETNIATLLTQAYARITRPSSPVPPIKILAVTNDSISTILSTAYLVHNPHLPIHTALHPTTQRVVAGIIAGTGTNATTMCPVSKVHPDKHTSSSDHSGQILLNTEWSINGTLPPIAPMLTKYDILLDSQNEKPGFQPFEELLSGRYLGELVRLIASDLITYAPLKNHPVLNTPYSFLTKHASELEATTTDSEARSYLSDVFPGITIPTQQALQLRGICTAVSSRAATVLATATVALLAVDNDLDFETKTTHAHIGDEELEEEDMEFVISYTGTVMEKYTNFRTRCQADMDRLMKECGRSRVRLVPAVEGGVVGAGVLAGMVKSGTA